MGRVGQSALYEQDGEVYLIVDEASYEVNWMGLAATWVCETAAQLESEIGLPAGSLQSTVDLYNRHAATGEDPLFHKGPAWVRPLVPPIGAVDLRIGPAPYAPFTLGGLETTVDRRGAATSPARRSVGCSPPVARRPGCARSATPAGSPSGTARCSAASPARAQPPRRVRSRAWPDQGSHATAPIWVVRMVDTERRRRWTSICLTCTDAPASGPRPRWTGAASKLDDPTSCDGWDVRTLMNHMLQTQRYFVGAARGEDVAPRRGDSPGPRRRRAARRLRPGPRRDAEDIRRAGSDREDRSRARHRLQRSVAARMGSRQSHRAGDDDARRAP